MALRGCLCRGHGAAEYARVSWLDVARAARTGHLRRARPHLWRRIRRPRLGIVDQTTHLRKQRNYANSPLATPATNARHSVAVNFRIGLSRSLLSRTAMPPSGVRAHSTQLWPLAE